MKLHADKSGFYLPNTEILVLQAYCGFKSAESNRFWSPNNEDDQEVTCKRCLAHVEKTHIYSHRDEYGYRRGLCGFKGAEITIFGDFDFGKGVEVDCKHCLEKHRRAQYLGAKWVESNLKGVK